MKEKEFKTLMNHYFRFAFEKVGVNRRSIMQNDKAEPYSDEEWDKLAEKTGLKKERIKKWRSEFEPFHHAYETLDESIKII